MARFLKPAAIAVILFGAIPPCGLSPRCAAAEDSNDAAFARHLEQLFKDGLGRRLSSTGLSRLNRHVAAATRYRPQDPAADYALGLVLLKQSRASQATAAFRAALRKSSTYLPAWEALLAIELRRNDGDSLQREAKRVADVAANARAGWKNPAGQTAAAEHLGRVVGFLGLPGVRQLNPKELAAFDAELKRRLGKTLVAGYEQGKSKLRAEHRELQANVAPKVDQARAKSTKKANAKLSLLEDRKAGAKSKQQDLKRTAAEWTTWLDQQTADARTKLTDLQKEFRALEVTDARIRQASRQNTIEIGRLRTALALKGIRDSRADMDPGMMRLQQQSNRIAQQSVVVDQAAAKIRLQAQQILALHAAARRKYQNATGKIARQDASMQRLQGTLKQKARKITRNQRAKLRSGPLKGKLTAVQTYFGIDYDQESKRLLARYRPSTKTR